MEQKIIILKYLAFTLFLAVAATSAFYLTNKIVKNQNKLTDADNLMVNEIKTHTTQVSSQQNKNNVPELSEKDTIQLFFSLINDGKIPEALDMMSKKMLGNEDSQQAWAIQFNDIRSVNVLNIEPADKSSSTSKYKITLEIYVDSSSANSPIPYYGWGDNPNIRWMSVINEDDMWKIHEISTGF